MTAPDAPPPLPADAYQAAMSRTVALFTDVDPATTVPATPEWQADQVLAHLVGLAADLVAGNVENYADEAWTAAQVEARRGRGVEELVAEWTDLLAPLIGRLGDPGADGWDEFFVQLPVVDLLAHEHDLREAIGRTGFSDPSVWPTVERRRRQVLTMRHTGSGLAPLEVRTPDHLIWIIGDGSPGATVVADHYELWRSLEGRRTRSAARAFDWSVDPEPYLDHWLGPVFRWVDEPAA